MKFLFGDEVFPGEWFSQTKCAYSFKKLSEKYYFCANFAINFWERKHESRQQNSFWCKTNRGFMLVYKIVPLKFKKKNALIQTNWRTTTRMSISLNVHRQNNLFQILWWLDSFAAEDNDAFPPPIWQSITSDHSV